MEHFEIEQKNGFARRIDVDCPAGGKNVSQQKLHRLEGQSGGVQQGTYAILGVHSRTWAIEE